MPNGGKVITESLQVVRPVALWLGAIAAAAYALAVNSGQATGVLLGAVLVLMAVATICQVHRAVSTVRSQSRVIHRAAVEAERHYVDVLRRIMKFVEAREKYADGHSQRVGQLAAEMAARLGLNRKECDLLGVAGELHDIGLLAIPEGVLTRHSRFGIEEHRTVRKHSQISYDILKPLESLSDVLPAIRHHHERVNGTGYPGGIVGEEIPLGARILAVADAYDAMTHDRPHRPATTQLTAMKELIRCAGYGYDTKCVEALADVVHLPKLAEAIEPAAAAAPA